MKSKIFTFIGLTALSFGSAQAFDRCDLSVRIDPKNNSISGTFKYTPEKKRNASFETGGLLIKNSDKYDIKNGRIFIGKNAKSIIIDFEGSFPQSPKPDQDVSDEISDRGISLMGTWYPVPDDICIYNFQATLPERFTAVSEANEIKEVRNKDTKKFQFILDSPVERVTLSASSEFIVQTLREGDIEIAVYFTNSNRDMMETYLRNASNFIKLYEEMLGKYPYRRFSIVENFLPTGYSMPTYTLIGSRIIKLPFIPETSLGHEILHQWFGNSIFSDDSSGNWSEGLTTYLADHYYEDMEGRGGEYRKNQMLDYNTFVDSASDYPPSRFKYRISSADRAIGYGKVSLFFHMLKILSGEKEFLLALRELVKNEKFRRVSYGDIQKVFEKATKKDLDNFFKSWLEYPGLPRLSVSDIKTDRDDNEYRVIFSITQASDHAFSFPFYVTFYSGGMKRKYRFIMQEKEQRFVVFLKDAPEKLQFDESYDTARMPAGEEIPARISDFLRMKKTIVIVPEEFERDPEKIKNDYASLLRKFPDAAIISSDMVRSDHLKGNCIILGEKNPYFKRLFDLDKYEYEGTAFIIRKNPLDGNFIYAYIISSSDKNLESIMKRIPHYGKFSDIVFDDRESVKLKDLYKTDSGIFSSITSSDRDVIPWAGRLEELPDEFYSEKILFMGEQHDILNHHINQLDLIKKAYRNQKGGMAIGLEMFQRRFQNVLNQYLAGEIKEREFLQKSSYFAMWGFDYRYYSGIIEFARKNKIDIIALNQNSDLVRKIAREGMKNLTEDEKKLIPSTLDLSSNEYKERLRSVFENHDFKGKMNFENFYTAQILWDETMAESLDIYRKNHPEKSIVVLAGNGHLEAGHGIPDRFKKRSGIKGKIILQDATLSRGEGDAIVFTGNPEKLPSIFEGVKFQSDENKGIQVSFLEDKSSAAKAGFRMNDVVLKVNNNPVKSLHDLKLEKYFCEINQKCNVVLLRGKEEVTVRLSKK